MNFRVGQKVVRVGVLKRQRPGHGVHVSHANSYPKIGEVCTIKTINHWPTWTALTFVEHDNSGLIGTFDTSGLEPGFDARYFRPVVERKTDISIFTKMLTDTRINEPV